jgi:hypothetical protein
MAPWITLELPGPRDGAMPAIILPPKFLPLLAAFEPSFCAPNYRNFSVQVAGWIHRLGRHTITAVASAAGAVCRHHISVFHRFFGRARWNLDASAGGLHAGARLDPGRSARVRVGRRHPSGAPGARHKRAGGSDNGLGERLCRNLPATQRQRAIYSTKAARKGRPLTWAGFAEPNVHADARG